MDLNGIDLKTWRRYEKVRTLYERNPGQYRLRLVLILLYGMASNFLLLVVLLLLGVFFWLFIMALSDGETLVGVILLVIALTAVIWFDRYMRVRDIPDGLDIKPGPLFDEVNDVCRELNIPPIREIRLDMSTNIAVYPRFRRQPLVNRDVLVIGYPLMCALDAKSFRIRLTRVLRHETPHARDPLLKWIERIWALPPVMYNPDTGKAEKKKLPPWLNVSFFPLRAKEERDGEAYCRDKFGAKDYTASVTQALFRCEKFQPQAILLMKFTVDGAVDHPAEAVLNEIRKAETESETKRLLTRMLRSSELIMETLPPFRERVGTNDPAELLPYLERTPDAVEHYLFSDAAFEAEYNGILKKGLLRQKKEEEFLVEIGEADPEDDDDENDEDNTYEEDENAEEETK